MDNGKCQKTPKFKRVRTACGSGRFNVINSNDTGEIQVLPLQPTESISKTAIWAIIGINLLWTI